MRISIVFSFRSRSGRESLVRLAQKLFSYYTLFYGRRLGQESPAFVGLLAAQYKTKKGFLMKKKLCVLMFVMMGLVGCEGKEEKEEEKPPPPPPSAQQLYKTHGDQLNQAILSNPGDVKNAINQVKSALRAEPNGQEALSMITSDVRDSAKAAYALAEESGEPILWDAVLVTCDALEALNPDDPRIGRYRERAQKEKERPIVEIRGFRTDPETDTDIATIDVTIPNTGERRRMSVQEGEEFLNYEFVEVIGNREGMVLKYKPTGKEYRVTD